MKTQYCAIIGDINNSRQLEKRGTVQKKFERVIEFINKEYKEEIASKFLITIGDEFQGLLHTPEKSYQLVRHFQDLMEPVTFSFGVGIGTLATPITPKAAIGMDGECFHRARAALQQAKTERKTICYNYSDMVHQKFTNAVVHLLDYQWNKFTGQQQEIVRLLRSHSQTETAEILKVTKQAISKVVNSVPATEWNTIEKLFPQYLSTVVPGSDKNRQLTKKG